MLAAWDVIRDELVTIRAGQADDVRPACHSGRLLCPVPGCPAPAITTRRAYTNRWGTVVVDGFRHLTAPDDVEHSPESLRHLDGKAVVAGWLRTLGFTGVRTERTIRVRRHHEHGRTRAGASRRRPDVVGRHPRGRMLAVEVQASPLGEAEWRQRTADLRRASRDVLWLWAWPADGPLTHAATTALRASVHAGHDVWFLEPFAEGGPVIGWAHQIREIAGEAFRVNPYDFTAPLRFDWRPIAEHTIGHDGALDNGQRADADRLAAAEDRERAAAERQRRRDEREAALEARRRDARRESMQLDATRAEAATRERAERAARRPKGGPLGPLPQVVLDACHTEAASDDRVWVPAFTWKAAVADWLLNGHRSSAVVRRGEVAAWIEQGFPCDRGTVGPAVDALLRTLSRAQVIQVRGDKVLISQGANEPAEPPLPW